MAAKNQKWSNHIASMDKNTTAFWRFAKQMKNKPSSPPNNRTNNETKRRPDNGPIRKIKNPA
jgi:hypothetical protein